jgi:hypothetical protein
MTLTFYVKVIIVAHERRRGDRPPTKINVMGG